MKSQVSERAVLARINRKLKKDDIIVKKCRESSRAYLDLGDYYSVDFYHNRIIDMHIDLAQLAKDASVLAPWETMAKS